MVDKNDTLLREVDEELRRERMEKIWQTYGIYLLGAAALLVAAVGGYKYMESKARRAAEAGGAAYEQAMALARAGKEDDAAKAFRDLAGGSNAGYAALAELKLAGSHLKSGRPKDAFEAFEKLAARPGLDPMMKGFAQIQAASLRLGEADFTEMQNRLTPLTGAGSPWRVNATELLGTAAFKAGKLVEARALLSPLLGDPMLSRSAVERVTLVMTAIAAAETPEAAAPVAPAATAVETKPADTKPAETSKPAESKPAELKPAEVKAGDAKDAKPTEPVKSPEPDKTTAPAVGGAKTDPPKK
jgi:hypothetical protein